jgi:hypothetical protein
MFIEIHFIAFNIVHAAIFAASSVNEQTNCRDHVYIGQRWSSR